MLLDTGWIREVGKEEVSRDVKANHTVSELLEDKGHLAN